MFAVITGGSKGIGFEIARELTKRGYDTLLIARSADELKAASDKLKAEFNTAVHTIAADLSQPEIPQQILDYINKHTLAVKVLVNNAGYGLWGSFGELPITEQEQMMSVNMVNLVKITHLLLPKLKENRQAYIMNVSSTTAYQPIANFSVYAASKIFVLSFTRALRRELKREGVSVSCLSPGTTTTNFIKRAGMATPTMISRAKKVTMEPSVVAAFAVKGMFAGRNEMIPGFVNWISVKMIPFMPKWLPELIAEKLYKK